MMKYSIRLAEPSDLIHLPDIEQAAAELFSHKDLPVHLRSITIDADKFEKGQQEQRLWVAVSQNGTLVAFLLVDWVDDNWHISEMDVNPIYVRKGIGSTLVSHLLTEADKRGIETITLTTFKHISWNMPFYLRHGFSVIKHQQCGPELLAILAEEKRSGLNNRIAMKHSVAVQS